MWHGLVEAPSAEEVDVGKRSEPCRSLFQDDVEQLIPVELRRGRPNANVGQPPADRVVRQVRQEEKAPKLVDISAQRDGSLRKHVLVEAPCAAPRVLPGAEVRAKITATLGEESVPLEKRLLHGPKEHCWTAGSGAHCQLVELMVCSMHLGETSTATSSDQQLVADAGVLGNCANLGKVDFVVSLDAISACTVESAEDVLKWAGEQKASASCSLQQGKTQLALLKYTAICQKLAPRAGVEAAAMPGLDDASLHEAASLRLASRLNSALCLLRLGLWQDAADACTDILKEDAANIKALFRRGKALLQLGLPREAVADLAQANQLDPGNREVTQLLRQCQALLKKAADKATLLNEQRSKHVDKWS
ncbi:FKBP4 [Symbiodinium natans]|uniref:FKBP4 protein n=1 Tax=Symbiodinium natans TaxID=878477 RepID=A0A812H798_9DINO|nr:FKBP4 [Symbiodinium natans]